jgi:pimeloyl-ACP methyl ester carboxylesterase
MSGKSIDIAGKQVWLTETGDGRPVLYLHGIPDLHGIEAEPMTFHRILAESCRLIAPAHPGCAETTDDETLETMDDVVFHYLRVLDALDLGSCPIVGSGIGGWIAAEIAVRHPERVEKLALIGATGLKVSGHPIGDIFWYAQPDDGVRYDGLRDLLFAGPRSETGLEMIPDAKDDIEREMLKYKVFRFASLIGFRPPYLHNPKLRSRLHRYTNPALVLWGERDSLVPRAHAESYLDGFPDARLELIAECGNSLVAEAPGQTADLVAEFLAG